jgi:hypothetical protein
MKKSVFPRAIGQLGLYGLVFLALVTLQFSAKGDFTRRINGMTVSGRYLPEGEAQEEDGGRLLAGGAKLFFGGIEFNLTENGGFALLDAEGGRQPLKAGRMIQLDDELRFDLNGGTELVFAVLDTGNRTELRIDAGFAADSGGLAIPFRLYRSRADRDHLDQFAVTYNGEQYQFSRSSGELEQGLLVLYSENPGIAYRAVPKRQTFSLADYVIAQGRNSQSFNEAINRWRDTSIPLWQQSLGANTHEDMVIAHAGEALRRGNYRAAVAAVPPGFMTGSQRGFESSLYLGGMDRAFRSFGAAERERISRISRILNEKSPDFLRENRVVDFLLVRGQGAFFERGMEMIRSFEPAALRLDLCAGVLEGHSDFREMRLPGNNPFEGLMERVFQLVTEALLRDSGNDRVFVSHNGMVDTELNFRLGKALWIWAEGAANAEWAAVGRSLVLSVLSLQDQGGTVPSEIAVSEGIPGEASGKVHSARFYRMLNPGEHHPRAVKLADNGIWAWTVSPALSAVPEGNLVDISVSFPVNETHYLIIRGIQPFSRIQLYNTNWPTDSQFERYDSSGWIYFAQEQTLVLKMKHRDAVEHIRIYSGETPPPPPPAPEAPAEEAPSEDSPQAVPQETQF